MVLIDFNGIAVGSILGQLNHGMALEENLVKHIILNNLRTYRVKYPEKDYGRMVVCLDKRSWRRDVYKQYKANRTSGRKTDDRDWTLIFDLINKAQEDIGTYFPYAVIGVEGAEADDIIGALTNNALKDIWGEKVVIISADKDFIQLHSTDDSVIQYSPMQQKMVKNENPARYFFEHLMKGDTGDGVPNVLSPDNALTDKIRQSPVTKKKLELWWDNRDNLKDTMEPEVYRNYMRNREMISLDRTPQHIKDESVEKLENYKYPKRTNILNYLIENKMKMLIECAGEF